MTSENDHSLLNDVARSIGSTLGTVAAKAESVTQSAPDLKAEARRAGAAAERKAKSVSRKVKASVKSGAATLRRKVKSTASSARKTFKGARTNAARETKRVVRKAKSR